MPVGPATLTGFATAWAPGATSNPPPFAPAVGTHTGSTTRAASPVGLPAALGATGILADVPTGDPTTVSARERAARTAVGRTFLSIGTGV
jgi:hypothetical protein